MADLANIARLLRGHGERLVAPLEPLATVGSATLGAAAGGLSGMAEYLRGRDLESATQAAAQRAQDMQGAMTYQPRTSGGQQALQDLLRGTQMVGEAITDVAPILGGENRGNAVLERTGSPALAAMAEALGPLDAVPGKAMFLGLQAARRAMANGDMVPMEMFKLADDLEGAGKSPEEVWAATGQYAKDRDAQYAGIVRGGDGQQRIEISDENMQLGELTPGQQGRLGDILRHDQLYELNPGAADLTFKYEDMDPRVRGSYSPRRGEISLNAARDMPPEQQRSVTAHELTHGIQDEARFEQGGDARVSSPQAYRRLFGEAEARLVQERLKMPLRDRQLIFPYATGKGGFDVPLSEQRASRRKR